MRTGEKKCIVEDWKEMPVASGIPPCTARSRVGIDDGCVTDVLRGCDAFV